MALPPLNDLNERAQHPVTSTPSTRVVKIDPTSIDPSLLAFATATLRRGGLVVFPTETVYGLGANALNAAAVERLFAVKGRPSRNPVIVHVAGVEQARHLVTDWPPAAAKLAARFWPGPLTLVLPRQPIIPRQVTAGGPTVAIRVPAQPIALALLEAAGLPIAAPSANPSSGLSPTTAQHVFRHLLGKVDLILDGGPTSAGIESTVIDLTRISPTVLRPGPVTIAQLEEEIGPISRLAATTNAHEPLPAPGMLARHYAPRATLMLATDDGSDLVERLADKGRQVGWLASASSKQIPSPLVRRMDMPDDAPAYAARLYAVLHELDLSGVDFIVVARLPDEPEWVAVLDRLSRAATPSN